MKRKRGNINGRPKCISDDKEYINKVLELNTNGYLPGGIANRMTREGLFIERRTVKKILIMNGCL